MESAEATRSELSSLLPLQGYQERTANVFPGLESLRWYVRVHRERLVSAGALLTIAGRLWVHPEKFDAAVMAEAAQMSARPRAGKGQHIPA